MAQSDSSIIIAGDSENVQPEGSDDAQPLSKVPTLAWIRMNLAKAVEYMFGPGEPKGKQLVATSESPSSSMYSSPRIERIMHMRSAFSTDLEFEIESSKDHWSEVAPMTDDSELVEDADSFLEQGILAGEHVGAGDRNCLDRLLNDKEGAAELDGNLMAMFFLRWPHRFRRFCDWEVGSKIGEGAQAEIFEAFPAYVRSSENLNPNDNRYVCKVYKKGFHLRDLQKLWPKQVITGYSTLYSCPIRYGTILDDGRFAFMMPRYWGDLRKLLDLRMQQRPNSNCPPLSDWEAMRSMECIAKGMRDLHSANIIHRDLKASNVLVEFIHRDSPLESAFYCRVADFECSAGVLGTTFWRAPEILLAAKNRNITPSLFTQQSDVYSYGMTCYEILTGCIPFENHSSNDYDVVLEGAILELPSHLCSRIHSMLKRCWCSNPLDRPTFQKICDEFAYVQSKEKNIVL